MSANDMSTSDFATSVTLWFCSEDFASWKMNWQSKVTIGSGYMGWTGAPHRASFCACRLHGTRSSRAQRAKITVNESDSVAQLHSEKRSWTWLAWILSTGWCHHTQWCGSPSLLRELLDVAVFFLRQEPCWCSLWSVPILHNPHGSQSLD